MSQQQQQNNRFLLAHSTAPSAGAASASQQPSPQQHHHHQDESFENQLSVDEDFDSYWEEEARNPHRNRIRIGRQYQATVPPLLKPNEKGASASRRLEDLETLSFCPKKSAKVSDAELDHYFTVAKSLNLFAELVETRSLLGRDVTIADLNHIKRKEGLSLASVIQPVRHHSFSSGTQPLTSLSPQQLLQSTTSDNNCELRNSTSSSPKDQMASSTTTAAAGSLFSDYPFNQPLMKALSHFISLHHPCHHDRECKKLLKDIPLEDNSAPAVSITAGNLRQGASTKEAKSSRSRSSAKAKEEPITPSEPTHQLQDTTSPSSVLAEQNQADNLQSPSYDDWTREEVELFSKAIEVCGKNFGSIKKEFLPSKSVKSIVEYYYIGSRDVSDNKKKSNQTVETSDSCGSQEKALANNNGQGGGSGPSGGPPGKSGSQLNPLTGASNSNSNNNNNSSSRNTTTTGNNDSSNKPLSDSNETSKQTSQSEIATNLGNLSKQSSKTLHDQHHQQNGHGRFMTKTPTTNASIVNKNIDARMSVYNFDEEFRDDNSSPPPAKFDCPRPGAEVKPLKAKPIVPNLTPDSEPSNSNVGSLKFFMDGQLVLKLNACQEQQEGIERCHWVQSGEKVINAARQKRYTKRAERSDSNQNGSQSNSVVSSFQDDDSKNDDLTGDEDSKESMNSFTNLPQQQKSQHGVGSPTPKRLKIKSEPTSAQQQQSPQLPSPINYNRLAVNNRMKERNDNLSPSSMINQATAMPWLQANSFAMAAALLKGLPFQPAPANPTVDNTTSQSNNMSSVNMATKPMDLSLEHGSPKATLHKPSSRPRGSRPKNA